MPPLGQHFRRRQTRRLRRTLDHLRQPGLSNCWRTVDAMHRAIETVRSPDAGTDLLLAARSQLVDDLRIGHVSPRHTDHIHQPRIDRISRRLNIGGPLIGQNS
jgi:hypothetical protein